MNENAEIILACLRRVALERGRRAQEPALGDRVRAVKQYQHARFQHSYAELLSSPRYGSAARFFLDELYGPSDFTDRDAQFARVVPALIRLFPKSVVMTVRLLAELHALSEDLDSTMGASLRDLACIDARAYQAAWRETGRRSDRLKQISLMMEIGRALDRYTSNTLMRKSLSLMRGPARAAGLGALQHFLETGFDAFREMKGADEFLTTISAHEEALANALFIDLPAEGLV